MTTTDKTGEQLVQSIRKTKATGATRSRATTPATPPSSAKAEPVAAETAPAAAADPYQHGRRVWPD